MYEEPFWGLTHEEEGLIHADLNEEPFSGEYTPGWGIMAEGTERKGKKDNGLDGRNDVFTFPYLLGFFFLVGGGWCLMFTLS